MGQVLVIFAGAIFLMMMLMAIVIDVSWYWVNSLRAQRAADAAALAGAVMLPQQVLVGLHPGPTGGDQERLHPGRQRVTEVFPQQDDGNPRRLNVRIQATDRHVLHARDRASADPDRPLLHGRVHAAGPDGQPAELLRRGHPQPPPEEDFPNTTGWRTRRITSRTTGRTASRWHHHEQLDGWAMSNVNDGPVPGHSRSSGTSSGSRTGPGERRDPDDSAPGLEVRLDRLLQGSGISSDCRMPFQLSWNQGNSWTAAKTSGRLPTSRRRRRPLRRRCPTTSTSGRRTTPGVEARWTSKT